MTQAELEQQVQKNTTAIDDLNSAMNNLATVSQLNQTNSTVDQIQTTITALQTAVNELQTSIGLINKLSKLLDVNIKGDLAKDDLLQFDGDRWTNIKPSEIGIINDTPSTTVTSLSDLSDVAISSKTHGQVLAWNAVSNKWINTTIEVSGGSDSDFDEAAMWQALGSNVSTKKISPTHINGQELSLTGISVNGSNIVFTNGSNTVAVRSSNLSATASIVSENEITAYA